MAVFYAAHGTKVLTMNYTGGMSALYSELNQLFLTGSGDLSAAETHGMLCGYVCAGPRMNGKAWIDQIIGHMGFEPQEDNKKAAIISLYNLSYDQISSMEFGFQLLLPDDDVNLPQRARSLGEWCQGFLTGLGLAGVHIHNCKTDEVRETLFRLAEISKIDYDTLDMCDADEFAFFEVCEYVRMAVLMLYTELVMPHMTVSIPNFYDEETVH